MEIRIATEEQRKRFVEQTWLNYFNRYLFEHGTISERDYKRMTEKIAARKYINTPESKKQK